MTLAIDTSVPSCADRTPAVIAATFYGDNAIDGQEAQFVRAKIAPHDSGGLRLPKAHRH